MMEQKNKKISVYLPLVLAGTLALGVILGIAINKKSQSGIGNLFITPTDNKIGNVLKYIEQEYVDTVKADVLTEDAIVALLKDLDPHSTYIPAKELQAVNEPLEGNFSGIGVQFNMQNDTVVVIATIPNGPSALLGIMPGDRIVKVNDTIVAGKKLQSDGVVKKLKGPRGTMVKVGIKRPGTARELVFDIKRDRIPLYSVDVAYMATDKIGFIKVNQFARNTSSEFNSAVNKLRAKGMKSLILDLRGNGGGYLDAAISLADQFLEEGKLIVYTQGRVRKREDFKATFDGICQQDKLVILIDELSASASEILSGAIQDNDRGLIIGRRSFGKGLVQEQVPLSDGSAIRLTVARYYTPTGRCIQKPYKKGVDDYYMDLTHRFTHGEFENKDSIKFNESMKFKTPKGKTVYGGGGIMPDIFVPFDTSASSKFYNDVRDLGLIYKFAFNYSDGKRNVLKEFKTYQELRKYVQNDNMFNKFIEYCKKQGLKPDSKSLSVSNKFINNQVQAYIARNFFDNDGFYPIIGEIDNTLKVAIDELNKK
jgi:carboxyl-terminal processing protease